MLSVGQFSPSSVYRSLVLTRARIHAHAIRARRWDRKPKHRSDKDGYERARKRAATLRFKTFRLRSVLAVPQTLPSPARRPPTRRARFRIKIASDDPSRQARAATREGEGDGAKIRRMRI